MRLHVYLSQVKCFDNYDMNVVIPILRNLLPKRLIKIRTISILLLRFHLYNICREASPFYLSISYLCNTFDLLGQVEEFIKFRLLLLFLLLSLLSSSLLLLLLLFFFFLYLFFLVVF